MAPTSKEGSVSRYLTLAIGFYQHPKLIDLKTSRTLIRWDDLDSGNQLSSITGRSTTIPPLALDPANKRFAVASDTSITVIQLG